MAPPTRLVSAGTGAYPRAGVIQNCLLQYYEFVQWPSSGFHLLVPRLVGSAPVWVDPHTGAAIGPLGELCAHADRWDGGRPSRRARRRAGEQG